MTAHMRFSESVTTSAAPLEMPRFEVTKSFDQKMFLKHSREVIILGHIGNLQVRIAKDLREVEAAQELRHSIFFGNGTSRQSKSNVAMRDCDMFDDYCDHLIVLDTTLQGPSYRQIIGTYRLLREDEAAQCGGFYSQAEFNIAGFIKRFPSKRVLELGRSCVLPQYRSKRTVELLWQGIWACCRDWKIDVLFGCGSFEGCNPAAHALPLAFLHHHARAMGKFAVSAHQTRKIDMDLMPVEAIDRRVALNAMPPLIKGYLRVGALFGEGAVIDAEFGSTDVFVILPVERIAARYLNHFGVDASRFS